MGNALPPAVTTSDVPMTWGYKNITAPALLIKCLDGKQTAAESFVRFNERLLEIEETQSLSSAPLTDVAKTLAMMVQDSITKTLLPVIAAIRQVSLPEGGVAFYFAPKDGRKRLAAMQCFNSGDMVAVTSDRLNKTSTAVDVNAAPSDIEEELQRLQEFLG